MTNLNNIVFFSFCRSLYRYTVYIFCQTEAAVRMHAQICILYGNPLFPLAATSMTSALEVF